MWTTHLNLCARHYNILNLSYRKKAALKLLSCVKYSQYAKDKQQSVDSERLGDKIIYNSLTTPTHYLEVFRLRKSAHKYDRKHVKSNSPVSLNLLDNSPVSAKPTVENKQLSRESYKYDSKPNLPYQYSIDYGVQETSDGGENERVSVRTGMSVESMLEDESIKGARTWMNDYEKYCSTEENIADDNDWLVNYGTADPDVPVSNVACGGCGAYLHCREPSLPGYLPSEIFLECKQRDLKALLCQRCHFLKNYNTALSVHVDPDKYVQLISKIKPRALVVLLVDLTDTTGSVWPEITDILGQGRPIFLVGNKVDLLWGDRVGWLNHVDKILRRCVPRNSRIIESCLISAKTGFGVEELVSKLHGVWKGTDDVYLVGCTNVGKSTLFNALIQSDYCKTKAVDLVQRAITAPWPGTTLNLLKFPILRPSAWRLAVRNVRLNMEKSKIKAETLLKKIQKQAERKRPSTPPQLIGNISHTFKNLDVDEEENPDLFSLPKRVKDSDMEGHRVSLVGSTERDFEGRWCFDTPGVLHKDQILNLLTAEELLLTIPREPMVPRTYLLYEGMSLFIACLARLDYIKGNRGVRVTVFSSNKLPVTICKSVDSDQVYKELLGSEISVVPQGSETRLKEWPGLSACEPITLCGVDREESCADVTFATTGWISVTPERNEICKLVAWSPLKRGISVRHPPLLPFAVKLRGKKIPRSPSYSRTRIFR